MSPTSSAPSAPPSQEATVCAPPDEDDEQEITANTSTAPSPYAPGTVISQKYELIRMLGEGGMGAVWVARNIALDAHVGLKLIRAEVSRNVPGMQGRLLQEARSAASLGHPAIIRVFDFGTTERGDPFIAMELLHGESLADLLQRKGKVAPARAVQTLLPIVDALATAHKTGIVHRDLKPDNIFLSHEGGGRLQPKVLDFGIAKAERSVAPHLTREGTVLGSPAYMSPEQARGDGNVDARSDIWAFSIVLYQLITGELPFVAENSNALLWAIVENPPLPFVSLGVAEPELWTIVARGLEKNRDQRWPEMFELGKALAEWLISRGVEEDICHASLRARWLEPNRKKQGDVLLSFFPSDAPSDHPAAALPNSVAITLSGHDSSSGVLLASTPAPALAGAVTQVAPPTGPVKPAAARRALPRWAVMVAAPLVAFIIAALARSALRVRSHEQPSPRETNVHVETPPEPRPQAASTEASRATEPVAPRAATSAVAGANGESPAAAAASGPRAAPERAKPGAPVAPSKRTMPKRKAAELKDPFH
jgi:serine/threonine protein kinase